MKNTKRRALYIVAALLATLFVAACLAGFAACGGDEHVHTWDAGVETTPATCITDGVKTYTCTDCGETKTETIAALGHDYNEDTTDSEYKEATCGADGMSVQVCSRCDDRQTSTVPATGDHTWGEGTVTKEATTEAEGEMTYTCTVCGETKTEKIDKLESSGDQGGEGGGDTGDTGDTGSGSGSGDTGDTGDTGDDGDDDDDDDEPEVDYSKVTDKTGEYSRVYGSTEGDAEGFFYGRTTSGEWVHFGGSVVTATLGENNTWTLSGTAGMMDKDLANAYFLDDDVYSDHIGCSYIAFGVMAGDGETVTMTVGDKTATCSEGTAQDACIYTWVLDVTDCAENWSMTVVIADESGTLCTYTIVLGTIERAHQEAEEDRVSATEKNSDDLKAGQDLSFEATDVAVTYDPETKTYTISGTSNVFGEELANAFYGGNGSAHAECEYITFTIVANPGETIKITLYNGETIEKVRAMYGDGVDSTTNQLTDDEGNAIQEASDGTWIIDVTPEVEGDFRMELEVEYENGDKVTYTIVLGKIERAHQEAEGSRVSAVNEGNKSDFTVDLGSGNTVTFDGSEIEVSYDPATRTYTISGTSAVLSADQLKALQLDGVGDDHEGCEYIAFQIVANDGEIINITYGNGGNTDGTRVMYGAGVEGTSTTDGAFVIDMTDHNEGDFWMKLEVTYANGDAVTYTIVFGKIERAHQEVEGSRVDAPKEGDADFSATVEDETGEEVTVTFTDSDITVSYDPVTRTYTIEGTSAKYSEEQLKAMQLDGDGAHTDCWYVSFKVTANAGETITIKTYNGDTPEKTWTLCGAGVEGDSTTDGAFILDTTDHTTGDWRMVLEVTYANGDKVTYTIVLGEIKTYCEVNGHTWDEGEVTTEPTCTEDGCITYICEVCGKTKTETIAASGHDYAETWSWSAQSSGDGYAVSAALTLTCSVCGDEQTNYSTEITQNQDGTYTGKKTLSGVEYTDTSRVFVEGSDGVMTDIGMGTEYTPVYDDEDESTVVSYELTSVPRETTDIYVVVAGYVNGLSVSVADYLSCNSSNTRTTNYIETLVFEEGVTKIGVRAFKYCYSLKTVVFCDTITVIGSEAFSNCTALTGSIEFWSDLTAIGENAFAKCSAVTSITFNEGLTTIGVSAFSDCTGLTGCIEIPSSVTSIGLDAFENCKSSGLTSIVIHGNANGTTIGDNAFQSCSTAELTVTFDGGSFVIGKYAFEYCNNLTTLIIINGATFTSVGTEAFRNNAGSGASPVTTVYYDGTTTGWDAIKAIFNAEYDNIPSGCKVYYYSDTVANNCWRWVDGAPALWNA